MKTTFINNVITNVQEFQIGCGGCSLAGFLIDHNTFYNSSSNMNRTTNGRFRSNILIGSSSFSLAGGSSGCVSCTISFNLCDSSGCVETGRIRSLGHRHLLVGLQPQLPLKQGGN